MKGGQASVENHQRCIDLCQELGIEVSASFMLGAPSETEGDIQLTYYFLKRNKNILKIDGFYLTTPVLWHDYGNPHYKITEYLNDLSCQFEMFHVGETGYVFFMKNVSENPSLVW